MPHQATGTEHPAAVRRAGASKSKQNGQAGFSPDLDTRCASLEKAKQPSFGICSIRSVWLQVPSFPRARPRMCRREVWVAALNLQVMRGLRFCSQPIVRLRALKDSTSFSTEADSASECAGAHCEHNWHLPLTEFCLYQEADWPGPRAPRFRIGGDLRN